MNCRSRRPWVRSSVEHQRSQLVKSVPKLDKEAGNRVKNKWVLKNAFNAHETFQHAQHPLEKKKFRLVGDRR